MVQSKTAFATALELWAESRERAITEVTEKAAILADQGRNDEAEYFRYVARLLTVRAMHERGQAAALRAVDEGSTADVPSPAHALA
jgi:hypothetical protein